MGLFSGLENIISAPIKAVEGIASELNPMHLLQEGMQMMGGMGMGGGMESASSFLPNLSIGGLDGGGGGGGGGSDMSSSSDSSGGGGGGDGLGDLLGDALPLVTSFL